MRSKLVIAALALIAASSAPLPAAAAGAEVDLALHHGLAHGSFALPDPATPGELHGRLFAPNGTALFAVHAHVTLGGAGVHDGAIDGVLVKLVGQNPGPFAEVHGAWEDGSPGEFRLHVIRPGDPSTGTPPELIGRIRGRFLDPNGALPPDGAFQAHWALDL